MSTTEFSYQIWSCPIFLLKPKRADWCYVSGFCDEYLWVSFDLSVEIWWVNMSLYYGGVVLGRWTICVEIAAFTKLNPWQRRHVNMPALISSCIILHGDFLKPWSYYLVEEQWTFSTVFDKIMRGELSSLESEAYAVDIDHLISWVVQNACVSTLNNCKTHEC